MVDKSAARDDEVTETMLRDCVGCGRPLDSASRAYIAHVHGGAVYYFHVPHWTAAAQRRACVACQNEPARSAAR